MLLEYFIPTCNLIFQENKSLKYVDVELMARNFYEIYPEYKRRKFKVFKSQIDTAFRICCDEMTSKRKEKKRNSSSHNSGASSSKSSATSFEESPEDDTSVRGSMNDRLSNMYNSPRRSKSNENVDDDDDVCEVIEEKTTLPSASSGENLVSSSSSKDTEDNITDFEKTKLKLKELKSKQESSVKTSRTPSRNLSAFMAKPGVTLADSEEDLSINNGKDSAVGTESNGVSLPSKKINKSGKATSENKRKEPSEFETLGDDPEVSSQITNAITEKVTKKKLNDSSGKKRKKLEVAVGTSNKTFADFGGDEEVLTNIVKLLVHLKHPEVYRQLGVTPPRGFLLHGPPGCGKTLLAHAIAGELQLPFIKISAPEIVSGVSGDSEQKLRELFEQAVESSPCVLFIDEVDCISPKRETAAREMERRIVSQLVTCLDDLSCDPGCGVVVIGATNRPDSLDPALRRAGRFDREIGLGIPDTSARQKILAVLCREMRLEPGTDLARLALLTPGYVGADLTSLTREAGLAAVSRVFGDVCQAGEDVVSLLSWLRHQQTLSEEELEQLYIQQSDWTSALKIVQPSAKREGFVTVPDVTWADVGALELVREELQLAILAPVNHREQFDSLGLPQSSGVLLVGPPGCGKTLVAKAIANEAGINFISVKGPELLNMYVGESERAVRSVFLRAKNSRPCVIFFDEVDSLAPKRSSGSSDGGSSSRVVNQLLTELDGVEGREGVWIMAATNRPDILDPAVLRPGRLDKILYVGFPESQERVAILRAITRNGTRPKLGADVSLELLGDDSRCSGFSGADVGNLVRQASMLALRDVLQSGDKSGDVLVQSQHFERAFSSVRPSVAGRDRERYQAMREKYGLRNQLEADQEKSSPENTTHSYPEIILRPDVGMLVRIKENCDQVELALKTGRVVDVSSDEVKVMVEGVTETVKVTEVDPPE